MKYLASGTKVKVLPKNVREAKGLSVSALDTSGCEGVIAQFDKYSENGKLLNKYEVSFDEQWHGWYDRKELKVLSWNE